MLKRKNEIIMALSYVFIFEVSILFPNVSSKLMLAMMLFNIIATMVNKENGLLAIMSSFLMSNEAIALINFIIILLLTKSIKKSSNKVPYVKIILIVIFVNSIISAIISNTLINVIFSTIYLLIILFCVSNLTDYVQETRFYRYIKILIIIEFIVFISLLMINKKFVPSDYNYGSLMNAHLFGNWLILVLLYLIGDKNIVFNIKNNAIYILLSIIMLYFSDSKSLLLCLFLTTLIYPIIYYNYKSNKNIIFKTIIIIYLFMYALVPLLKNKYVEHFIYNYSSNTYKYIYDDYWNYKFKYIEGTLYNELKYERFIFGYGLGQYGSRFANLFTYDVSYRNDSTLNNFVKNNFNPHYNQNYAKYISFYNTEFVEGIQWRSAVLSYPYNSMIAIIGETGWLGVIIIALFIEKQYNNTKYIGILLYFLFTCLFDNYFDMFLSIGFVMLILSIKKNKSEENEEVV